MTLERLVYALAAVLGGVSGVLPNTVADLGPAVANPSCTGCKPHVEVDLRSTCPVRVSGRQGPAMSSGKCWCAPQCTQHYRCIGDVTMCLEAILPNTSVQSGPNCADSPNVLTVGHLSWINNCGDYDESLALSAVVSAQSCGAPVMAICWVTMIPGCTPCDGVCPF